MALPASSVVTILADVDSPGSLANAEAVQKSLATDFDINSRLRSLHLPIDRLLHDSTTLLYVGLEAPPTTPLFVQLKEQSTHPLWISACSEPCCALQIAKWVGLANPSVAEQIPVYLRKHQQAQRARQQTLLTDDAERVTKEYVATHISSCYDDDDTITGDAVTVVSRAQRFRGKVRDRWEPTGDSKSNLIAMVTTDRQSGFDRQLAMVPFKGAVLNLCSAFWFDAVSDIIPHHLISIPHPSVSIVKRCDPFPIEFVVRSYLTGSTNTSIWKNYQNGVRNYCGHALPDGMTRNQKLSHNLLTPTTKADDHDRPLSLDAIVTEGHMTQVDLDVCARAALAIFARGQTIAAAHGLILVDTKYEFGRCCVTGDILLIDEVHTPDSSRYWLAASAAERIAAGLEPENIDKEFLRLWFRERCDPYNVEETLPKAPRDLVVELSRRYIQLYEMITWNEFDFAAAQQGEDAISKALEEAFQKESTGI